MFILIIHYIPDILSASVFGEAFIDTAVKKELASVR